MLLAISEFVLLNGVRKRYTKYVYFSSEVIPLAHSHALKMTIIIMVKILRNAIDTVIYVCVVCIVHCPRHTLGTYLEAQELT